MEKHQPFVIPAGVRFEISEKGVFVEHAGDIILNGSLGKNLDRVISKEGSITLRGRFDANHIEALNGTVRLDGAVEVGSVRGEVVEIVGRRFKARSVRAGRQIMLGGLKVTADVLMAPRIDVDPKAQGLVTILESHNVVGPNAIKGGFTVAEYNEIIGDAAAYLGERGVEMLDKPESATEEEEEDQEDDEDQLAQTAIEANAEDDGEAIPTGSGTDSDELTDDPDTSPDAFAVRTSPPIRVAVPPSAPVEPVEPSPASDDSDEESLPEVGEEALEVIDVSVEPLPDDSSAEEPPTAEYATDRVLNVLSEDIIGEETAPVEPIEDPTYDKLVATLQELMSNYAGNPEPPALADLGRLIEDRDYDAIRAQLPRIWNDLVKYHRETGLRIRRQVTATFNNIMSIVKSASTPGKV
jgi:hypothetical protein